MATHEVTRPLALNVTALEIAQALQDVIVTTPVVDNLTTNDSAKALSAKQGKVLKDAHDVNVAAITGIRGTSSAYSSSATYAVGDYAIYNNVLYRCKTAVSTPEAFDAAKWDAVDLKTNRDAINAIMTESSDRIKFRDGTMIYWGNDSLTPSSVGLNSKRVPISSSFVSISSYSVSAYQENIAGVYVSNVSIAGSQLDAYFYCPSASYTVHYTYMIIGRWK